VEKSRNSVYSPARHGFALYFSPADTIQAPYLVYVPEGYDPGRPWDAIVFLHGGVVSLDDFNDKDPNTAEEPIFAAGNSLHAIVIYPFAKKAFGWVSQQAAFEQVLQILKETGEHYHINKDRIALAGVSNGGSALFWYASRRPNPFKGFLAISALPKLETGPIDFSRFDPVKPFYSIHARHDEVFPYDSVNKIYQGEHDKAAGWQLDIVSEGGHDFIYEKDGEKKLLEYLRKIFSR
jgi:predicted peptidase